jgi:hypothetical protein
MARDTVYYLVIPPPPGYDIPPYLKIKELWQWYGELIFENKGVMEQDISGPYLHI